MNNVRAAYGLPRLRTNARLSRGAGRRPLRAAMLRQNTLKHGD